MSDTKQSQATLRDILEQGLMQPTVFFTSR